MEDLGWYFPTSTAKKAHYFTAQGERSACGAYYAGVMILMTKGAGVQDNCCEKCWRKTHGTS